MFPVSSEHGIRRICGSIVKTFEDLLHPSYSDMHNGSYLSRIISRFPHQSHHQTPCIHQLPHAPFPRDLIHCQSCKVSYNLNSLFVILISSHNQTTMQIVVRQKKSHNITIAQQVSSHNKTRPASLRTLLTEIILLL